MPIMMTSAYSTTDESEGLPAPPRADVAAIALFVDVDGTLLDIASRPDAVVVDPSLRSTLHALRDRLGGALAPLSGRPLHDIDALLGLASSAAAGLHGAELRGPDGGAMATPFLHAALDAARAQASKLAGTNPGVLVEDKGVAIALHYRAAPNAEMDVRRAAIAMLEQAGPDYELLYGKLVIELKPKHADKGTALATLMNTEPFAGRRPWMIGDDLTDEDAFVQANALGGVSVIVGPRRPTLANFALPGPAAVRAWMECVLGSAEPAQ
jgi:trehalose 6-phosphate phosphatase